MRGSVFRDWLRQRVSRLRQPVPSCAERHLPYFELLEVLQAREIPLCPLCGEITRRVHRWLERVLYESVNDPAVRTHWRRANGLCAMHAGWLERIGDRLGAALLYLDLLDQTDPWMAVSRGEKRIGDGCPACRVADEEESRMLATLVTYWDDAQVQFRMKTSSALCRVHALQLASHLDPARTARLRRLQEDKLDALRADLRELVRALGAGVAGVEATPRQRRALQGAIAFFSGRRAGRAPAAIALRDR